MELVLHAALASDLSSLPVGVLVSLGVLIFIEVALDVFALVDLYRRPPAQVALSNKWVWVAIIVLLNIVGPILYLVAGRKVAGLTDEAIRSTTAPRAGVDIGDALYGRRDDTNQP